MQEIADTFKISKSSVENHLYQLGYVNHFGIWVSHKWEKPYFIKKTYIFLAVLGLCCCPSAFSSCSKWGLLSSCSAKGFSLWGLLFLQSTGSRHVGFSSCGTTGLGVLQHVRSSQTRDQTRVHCNGRWIPDH